MEALLYIVDVFLRNFIRQQWYIILLLLYIQMSGFSQAELVQPMENTPGTTLSSTSGTTLSSTPGTTSPSTTGTTSPSTTGTTSPSTTGTTSPSTTETTSPRTSRIGTTLPSIPGTTLPSTTGTTSPSTTGTTSPSTTGTTSPRTSRIGTTLPSIPGTTSPSTPGTTLPSYQSSNTMQTCTVSVSQSCPCNSTGLYCASLNPPLTEVPNVDDKRIMHLDVTGNVIHKLKSSSFLELEFLITLCLGHNNISFIDPQAFNNLYRLETLNLENNMLTNLDHSGRTFQHLTSLKLLNLRNNRITKVNKYSFITMNAISTPPATVNLENNPIQCDCDVRALWQWEQEFSSVFINIPCIEGTESTFGSCNDSTDGIFSGETQCPICVNESTNSRCNLRGLSVCDSAESFLQLPHAVCHKTVTWNNTSNKMSLTSGCVSYEDCLPLEANNGNSCAFDFMTDKSVACDFCCKGPTCSTDSFGGRTRDFTFYLSIYTRLPSPVILNPLNTATSEQIVSAFSDIKGGIDGNIHAIIPQFNDSYRIVVQLLVTTFSFISERSVSEAIMHNAPNFAAAFHLTSPLLVAVTTYVEGLDCQIPTETCPGNMTCIAGIDGQARCLCDNSSFYLTTAKTCSSLTMLQVKNISVSSMTTDKVILNWTSNKHKSNVSYTVLVTPNNRRTTVSSVTNKGAVVSGLDPGTEYNFTITSTLTTPFFERLTDVSLSGVWTKLSHGMTCDAPTDMCAADLSCQQALDGRRRCLCNSSSFYCNSSRACLPVTKLQVSNLTVLSNTNNSVKFAWTANKFGTNVTYKIWPSPYKGQIVASSLTVTGAVWTGLDSGSRYNFTVTATLIADFYSRSTNTTICDVWTKAVHGDICNVSAPMNANVCMGSNLRCINMCATRAYCVCSPGYYFSANNTCRDVNELQVKNLNASSITNDTVTLSWTADKHKQNVRYRIGIQPHTGQEVPGSVSKDGGKWTGLNPGTQYNFSVTSILPAAHLYKEITVVSEPLTVWTKEMQNVTVIINYVKENAEFLPFMSNSSSQEYLNEAKRIISGIKSVLVKAVDVVFVELLQFRPVSVKQYQVDVLTELTTYDVDTIGQVLSNEIQNSTDGFFYKEYLHSLDMTVNSSETISYQKCPYSVTSFDKGGIKWNDADVGLHYSLCTYNNPLDHPMPMASRKCSLDGNELPVWGEVNASLCITKEEAKKPDFMEVFERNITKGNAEVASGYLRTITNDSHNLTSELMHKSVSLLETLTTEEILQQPDVATNVIESVSNMINVNIKMLQQSQTEGRLSARLLDVIDSVANKAPLTEGKLKITTPNLAVAAQKVDANETRDITLVTSANTGNENDVNINVLVGDNSQLNNTTSLMIPMSALVNSLNSQQKQNLSRISFIVQRSDILFSVIRSSKNTQRLNDDNDNYNHNIESNHNDSETRRNESFTIVTKINSQVLSASVPDVKVEDLSRNITTNFQHTNNRSENPRCVFWDENLSQGKGDWSDAGCGVIMSDLQSTTCGCNHLTNFALLMDVYEQGSKLSPLDRQILSIISYIGCAISCLALIITLLTYSVFKQVTQYSLSDHTQPKRKLRRDNPSKILINLCLALLCSNLVFLLGMQDYSFGNTASCKAVAVLLHYFLLASLTWMAVEAFYMYLALVVVFKTYYTHFILKCSLVGWGVPLLIVIITLGVNKTDNYGFINSGMCWLKNPAFYAAFVGPVCFILLINCMAFILVVKQLASMSSVRLHKTERNSTVQRLRGAVGVVILLGLTWIFAIFAIDQASVAFYYLFAIFNSLQGLFIFIFYCLLKTDAVVALKRSLPCFEDTGESSKSYSHSKGVSYNAAGHHLMENKSSSSKKDSSKATLSTTLDSRKDSCFSTLSGSNGVDEKDSDELNQNTSVINNLKATSRLLHSEYTSDDTSSNISTNSDKPVKYSSGIVEEDPDQGIRSTEKPPSEIQDTSFCQHSPGATSGSFYTVAPSYTADPLPEIVPSPLNLSQTSKLSTPQTDFAENSSLEPDHQTDKALKSSVRVDGEIDCSHLASVSDILNKLESNISQVITDIENNVITDPEQASQDTGDGTSAYIPPNSDTPTKYLENTRHGSDTRIESKESPKESHDSNFYENLPVAYTSHSIDIPTPLTDDPQRIPTCLIHRLQTSAQSSQQTESPDQILSCSLDPSHETDQETLDPSFTPFRADGEIDYSHLASVSDIHNRFEWLASENSDKNVTYI